jgi:putative Holliday junction resolvase
MATLLGLDFGLKHIGVAVGQTITRSATPMTTVNAADGRPDWTALDALIHEWQPERLIVGLPLNMDGTRSDMAKRAQRFANRMNARYRLPVEMRDERLTSQEARSLSDDPDTRHAIAAQLILKAWLEDS